MQRLWAPWRIAYVGQNHEQAKGECVFCHAASHPAEAGLQVLSHNEHSIVLMNKYPYSNGHMMAAPKRHVGAVNELSREERLALMDMLALGCQALQETLQAQGVNAGFNLGQAAGAGIPGHIHLHIVPRWANDVNFMTSLADVRVIPEHLETTYQKLREKFARLGEKI
jgi:ATP adenylyltransferase